MIEKSASSQNMPEFAPLSRIRRNHGLEHATLHILAERHPGKPMAGHSDASGFWIISELSEDQVASAVQEALSRLRAGEAKLAVHPNCGTNIATAGVLAGLAAGLAMYGAGRKLRNNLERLPTAIALATLALIAAQPLGLLLQERFTTSGVPGDLHVLALESRRISRTSGTLIAHRIKTQG